jgi:hypothetical protein
MIIEDMERRETYIDFDESWSCFDVYKMWKTSLVDAIAARKADPTHIWYERHD